jgi:hypothetical protein
MGGGADKLKTIQLGGLSLYGEPKRLGHGQCIRHRCRKTDKNST